MPLRSPHASTVLQAAWHLALSMPRGEARRLMPRKRVTGYRTAILGNGTRAAKSETTVNNSDFAWRHSIATFSPMWSSELEN